MKKLMLILLIFSSAIQAQEVLSLADCYDLVEKNYPLVQQKVLLNNQLSTETEVIRAGQLPQVKLFSQVSYQSDIINLPIPNSTIQGPNKDQYRNELQLSQLIYGSGVIEAKSNLIQKTIKPSNWL